MSRSPANLLPFCHTNPLLVVLHDMHEPVLWAYYFTPAAISIFSRSTFPPLHVQTSPTLTLSPLMYSFIIVSFPVTVNKEPSVFSYLDHASHTILFGQTENRFCIWDFF